jgi:hypothetical protein
MKPGGSLSHPARLAASSALSGSPTAAEQVAPGQAVLAGFTWKKRGHSLGHAPSLAHPWATRRLHATYTIAPEPPPQGAGAGSRSSSPCEEPLSKRHTWVRVLRTAPCCPKPSSPPPSNLLRLHRASGQWPWATCFVPFSPPFVAERAGRFPPHVRVARQGAPQPQNSQPGTRQAHPDPSPAACSIPPALPTYGMDEC